MPLTHADYKHSVTFHSDDLFVVACLRALSKYSQRTGNNQIPWGGTKDHEWASSNNKVTFHFSTPAYRDLMVKQVERLLPTSLWDIVGKSESDPARKQS